jgi:hypothetical protein
MSMLLWYLPFLIMSGYLDALYKNDGIQARGAETPQG